MSNNPLIDSLLPSLNSVLGVRDSIGAVLHHVYFLTRTWTGSQPGEGNATDSIQQVYPTPLIVDYSHNIRLVEGGAIKQGDIILKGFSKSSYPHEEMINAFTRNKKVERFYLIDDRIYNIINVKDRYLTWEIQVRKLSNQTRYKEVSSG